MEGNIMLTKGVHPLLTDTILETLASKNIVNIFDFMEADVKLLFNIIPISVKNICDIKEAIILKKSATVKTGLELYNDLLNDCIFPSHIKELDELLGGGFQTGYIYEICGESLSGKTILGYNVISNLSENQKVYYIDTKANFSTSYLKFLMDSQNRTKDYIKTKFGNLLVKTIFSLNELLLALYDIKEEMDSGLSLKFILINSMPAIYYTEETDYAYSMINLISNILRLLAVNYRVVILVSNLITTWTEGNLGENCTTNEKLCCGNYWRNIPHARIKMCKYIGYSNKFHISLVKSCILTENKCCDILLPLNSFENICIKFYLLYHLIKPFSIRPFACP